MSASTPSQLIIGPFRDSPSKFYGILAITVMDERQFLTMNSVSIRFVSLQSNIPATFAILSGMAAVITMVVIGRDRSR